MSGEPRRQDLPLASIYGVGKKTAAALQDAGYNSTLDVAEADATLLAESIDLISEEQAEDFIIAAQSMLEYWPD